MSRDRRGNRTQEVVGSSPFSSTKDLTTRAAWFVLLPRGGANSNQGTSRRAAASIALNSHLPGPTRD